MSKIILLVIICAINAFPLKYVHFSASGSGALDGTDIDNEYPDDSEKVYFETKFDTNTVVYIRGTGFTQPDEIDFTDRDATKDYPCKIIFLKNSCTNSGENVTPSDYATDTTEAYVDQGGYGFSCGDYTDIINPMVKGTGQYTIRMGQYSTIRGAICRNGTATVSYPVIQMAVGCAIDSSIIISDSSRGVGFVGAGEINGCKIKCMNKRNGTIGIFTAYTYSATAHNTKIIGFSKGFVYGIGSYLTICKYNTIYDPDTGVHIDTTGTYGIRVYDNIIYTNGASSVGVFSSGIRNNNRFLNNNIYSSGGGTAYINVPTTGPFSDYLLDETDPGFVNAAVDSFQVTGASLNTGTGSPQ